ncbi:diphthine--ammonia ligase [Chloroflexota bacterium]
MTKSVLLTWSGGKDSTIALYELEKAGHYQVTALITTVTKNYDRISMHGVRRILLEQQAASLDYPLKQVSISSTASNDEYEASMQEILEEYLKEGVSIVAFGDIFLEDIRKYREENLSRIGMKGVFPIWKRDTAELARTFIDLGFKAVITCIDSKVLDKSFVGRIYDEQFLSELPSNVDPCGENGEFHSFVYEGPMFGKSLSYKLGEVVLRDERFYFCDLIPLRNTTTANS